MKTKIATLLMLSFLILSVSAFADGVPKILTQQQGSEYLGNPDVDYPHDINYDEPPWWTITAKTLPDLD
jgi:hypothetical protein